MSKIPKVRIQYSWLLEKAASEHIRKGLKIDQPIAPSKATKERVEHYKKAWQPYEKEVLTAIQKITGLKFSLNYIDVYIAPFFAAFSEPLVIGSRNEPDVFIDVLTHELIHRICGDNTKYEFMVEPDWAKVFGEQYSEMVLAHIQIHAIHKAIYLDYLKEPRRLERDIHNSKTYNNAKAYAEAWDYVEEHGYKEIIKKFKQAYKDLANSQN